MVILSLITYNLKIFIIIHYYNLLQMELHILLVHQIIINVTRNLLSYIMLIKFQIIFIMFYLILFVLIFDRIFMIIIIKIQFI